MNHISTDIALAVEQLHKTYRPRTAPAVTAVNQVSLVAPGGQMVGVLGPGSTGKTTLIRLLGGLEAPGSGTIMLNGYDLAREREAALRQVGVALDDDSTLNWRRAAWDNLCSGDHPLEMPDSADTEALALLLDDLHLWEHRLLPVRRLSQSARHIIAVARAFVGRPPIVLLDNPTRGLDAHAAQILTCWIGAQARTHGTTVVVTTHHLDLIQTVCDRAVLLYQGQIIADLPAATLSGHIRKESLRYQIRLRGHLDDHWLAWFDQMTLAYDSNGETVLSGPVPDQSALHGMLGKVRDMGIPLVAVTPLLPNLAELCARLKQQLE